MGCTVPSPQAMEPETPERLSALWKSGRDKFRSFFTVLNEVRKEIGDEALAEWCIKELHIGISVINTTAGILTKVDADIARAEIARALKIERDKAKCERAAAKTEALRKQRRKLIGKASVKSKKLKKARAIVRPLIEQGLKADEHELHEQHPDVGSHTLFYAAITAERARREVIEELYDGTEYDMVG